jgi:ketosteroid isomerase-like protein
MQPSCSKINGSEGNLNNNEEQALSIFYRAFNERNMQLMQQSWLNTDEISMNNPIGGIRRGWLELQKGYDKIFNGKAKVFVELYDFSVHSTEKMFFVVGKERGYFKTEQVDISLAIRTSRVFIKSQGEWRQIHHHGSIDNPDLLKNYQAAIL